MARQLLTIRWRQRKLAPPLLHALESTNCSLVILYAHLPWVGQATKRIRMIAGDVISNQFRVRNPVDGHHRHILREDVLHRLIDVPTAFTARGLQSICKALIIGIVVPASGVVTCATTEQVQEVIGIRKVCHPAHAMDHDLIVVLNIIDVLLPLHVLDGGIDSDPSPLRLDSGSNGLGSLVGAKVDGCLLYTSDAADE